MTIFAWWPGAGVSEGEVREKSLGARENIDGKAGRDMGVFEEGGTFLIHGHHTKTNNTHPFFNKSKTIAALVNGQFYDGDEIRKSALMEGVNFSSDINTDILIYMYQKYGVDAIKYLNGEFSFVLWDRQRGLVWVGRDGAGVKSLRYVMRGDELVFSSKSKVLLKSGWNGGWDNDSLMQSISMQYIEPERTLFKHIKQVKPGSDMVFLKNKKGEWETIQERTWHVWFEGAGESKNKSKSDEQVDEEFEYYFSRAIKRRVDGPNTAIHLSGGCDSSAALAGGMDIDSTCEAWSVRFVGDEGEGYDESDVAMQSARALGSEINIVEVGSGDIWDNFERAIYKSESVAINGHLSAKYLLSKAIYESGGRVSISGEGSDEAMLGYPFFKDDIDVRTLMENKISIGSMLSHGKELDFSLQGERPKWLLAKQSIGYRLHKLMREDFLRDNYHVLDGLGCRDGFRQKDPIHRASALWAKYALGGYILPSLADGVESGFNIHGRVPFLDIEFLRASGSWGRERVITDEFNKAPLRRYLIKRGLENVARRKKHPFEAPPILKNKKTRKEVAQLFMDDNTWYNTPLDTEKIKKFVKQWERMGVVEYQMMESVVCLIISIYFIKNQFDL